MRSNNYYWLSGFLIPKKFKIKLEDLITLLNKKLIGTKTFWFPLHKQKPYKNCYTDNLSYTNSIYKRIVTLPSSTNISEKELNYVSIKVNEIIKAYK